VKIYLTHHARLRMVDRGITEDMVTKALTHPDETGTGYRGRAVAFRAFPSGRVKVVYKVEGEDTVVISAMWS